MFFTRLKTFQFLFSFQNLETLWILAVSWYEFYFIYCVKHLMGCYCVENNDFQIEYFNINSIP